MLDINVWIKLVNFRLECFSWVSHDG
jgi:hypothetical protein